VSFWPNARRAWVRRILVFQRCGGKSARQGAVRRNTGFNGSSMSADEAQAGEGEGERKEMEELQFDRVETGMPGDASSATPVVACTLCRKSVGAQYYHVNGKPFCENCRHILISATATPRTIAPLIRAAVFGLGGALGGAGVYYAVARVSGAEIGLVAIVTGYMVGYCVHKGAGGRGGRRFQILAVLLTYWSVGLAYAALASRLLSVSDAVTVLTHGAVLLLAFMLPVLSIVRSMPFGLLSALIIAIGLRQAWSMTAAPKLAISGPYKVGTGPEPVSN
jgi:hypothetical protein